MDWRQLSWQHQCLERNGDRWNAVLASSGPVPIPHAEVVRRRSGMGVWNLDQAYLPVPGTACPGVGHSLPASEEREKLTHKRFRPLCKVGNHSENELLSILRMSFWFDGKTLFLENGTFCITSKLPRLSRQKSV